MPIKVKLHDSTSQVEATGSSSSVYDKKLEALIKQEIKDRIG